MIWYYRDPSCFVLRNLDTKGCLARISCTPALGRHTNSKLSERAPPPFMSTVDEMISEDMMTRVLT